MNLAKELELIRLKHMRELGIAGIPITIFMYIVLISFADPSICDDANDSDKCLELVGTIEHVIIPIVSVGVGFSIFGIIYLSIRISKVSKEAEK